MVGHGAFPRSVIICTMLRLASSTVQSTGSSHVRLPLSMLKRKCKREPGRAVRSVTIAEAVMRMQMDIMLKATGRELRTE